MSGGEGCGLVERPGEADRRRHRPPRSARRRRRSRPGAPSGDMAACGGLSIQLLLEAADYLERRERGTAGSPLPRPGAP